MLSRVKAARPGPLRWNASASFVIVCTDREVEVPVNDSSLIAASVRHDDAWSISAAITFSCQLSRVFQGKIC